MQRQNSLTPAEINYLDALCIKGNVVEVQLATSKLQDDSLFFVPTDKDNEDESSYNSDSPLNSPVKSGEEESPTIELLSFPSTAADDDDDSVTSNHNNNVETIAVGSHRRMVLLQERKNSHLMGKMWKAHENGVVLSKQGSRRSLLRRNTTALFARSSTDMFRNDGMLLDDIRSDNNRRSLSSKGRSKSVSFKPQQGSSLMDDTVRSMPPRNNKMYCRSSSIGSLPSIRQAHVLSSSSTISIGSLRRGNALFEESFSSIASPQPPVPKPMPLSHRLSSIGSIHRAHSVHSEGIRDDDEVEEDAYQAEKKMDEAVGVEFLPAQILREGIEMTTDDFDCYYYDGDDNEQNQQFLELLPCSSFDESVSHQRQSSTIFRRVTIHRTYSDSSLRKFEDDISWRLGDDTIDESTTMYDPWSATVGADAADMPFAILGTSADDVDAHPHVLSPPLMESLQAFLPVAQSGDNFWLKYSLVRDGASMYTFLQRARGAQYAILSIETVDGEVFGAFTTSAWRKNWNFFGTSEAFLWRMRQSRKTKCHSILDQAHLESEIDVYPYTGANSSIQLCLHDKLAVGGGSSNDEYHDKSDDAAAAKDNHRNLDWGFGLTIAGDFLHGTSAPCLTFGSPSLSTAHADGSVFEIMNVELWSLTPCADLAGAEQLELGKLFLSDHHAGRTTQHAA